MTPVQTRANGLVIPPLPQLWLTAVLRMLVELVRNVALLFMTNKQHPARDWHTDDDVAPIMMMTNDIIKERNPVAASDNSPIALILRDRVAIVSKDGGVLTTVSHTAPSPSVSRALHAIHLPLLRMGRQARRRNEGELPPSVRSTGGGGLRALARKTEGVRPLVTAPA